jgi:hypothetical protein
VCAWLLPAAASAGSELRAVIEASRGSDPAATDVAPLAVFFDAVRGTQWAGRGEAERWRDLRYTWDFGDPQAGRWSRGVQGARSGDRNRAEGPLAAHVYERPGRYRVTLRVVDPASGASAEDAVVLEVDDPDRVFAGERSVCLANGDRFDGCPAGARRVAGSRLWSEVGLALAPGQRTLLRRGDRWRGDAPVLVSGAGPGHLGAFGEGPPPAIDLSSGAVVFDGASDWRLQGLRVVGGAGHARAFAQSSSIRQPLSRLLWLDVDVVGGAYQYAFEFGLEVLDYMNAQEGGANRIHDELFVVDGEYATRDNVWYGAGERLALLGNRWGPGGAHGTRITWADRALVQHNHYEGFPYGFEGIKWHAGSNFSDVGGGEERLAQGALAWHRYSQEGIVSDNVFARASVWYVSIGAQNDRTDERLRRFLVERNRLVLDGDPNSRVGVWLGAADSALRENVASADAASGGYWFHHVAARPAQGLRATGVRAEHNTCLARDARGEVRCVNFAADSLGGTARDNLLFAPGAREGARVVAAESARAEPGGCPACNVLAPADPFVRARPSDYEDFALRPDAAEARAGADGGYVGALPPR